MNGRCLITANRAIAIATALLDRNRPFDFRSAMIALLMQISAMLAYHQAMPWVRRLHQRLSHKVGFAHGLRNRRPFRFPWWVDSSVYGPAYNAGYKEHCKKLGR
jgi:hypothetical protein